MSFDRQSNQIGFDPYVSHKHVRAARVKVIYGPTCGWWCIAYADGYISFCPPEAFSDGYTLEP